jgi:hypothetical protein
MRSVTAQDWLDIVVSYWSKHDGRRFMREAATQRTLEAMRAEVLAFVRHKAEVPPPLVEQELRAGREIAVAIEHQDGAVAIRAFLRPRGEK